MLSSSSSSIEKSSSTVTLSFLGTSDCTNSGLISPLSDRHLNDISSTVYDDDDELFSSRLPSTSDIEAQLLPLNNPCYSFSQQEEKHLEFNFTEELPELKQRRTASITQRFPLQESNSCLPSISTSPNFSLNSQQYFSSFCIDDLSAPILDYLDEKLIQNQMNNLIKQRCCSSSSLTSSCDLPFNSFNTRSSASKRLIFSYLNRFRKAKVEQISKKIIKNINSSENLFGGMSLNSIQSKTEDGTPLPRFIHDIMDYIAGYAHLMEWLFRKNGVKGRIEEIKECCSQLSTNDSIPANLLEDSQLYNLCDVLKLFFRSLPECLFTDQVSRLLQNWLRELPSTYSSKHFQAAQYAMLILPSANRETLIILLRFLCGISKHSDINKMNSLNLATCWMPSLFQFFNQQPLQQKQNRQTTTALFSPLENGGNGIRKRLMRRKTIEISLVNGGGITTLTTTENTSPTLQLDKNLSKDNYDLMKQLLSAMIDGWEKLTLLPISLAENKYLNNLINGCKSFNGSICVKIKRNGQFEFNDELHQKLRRMLFRLKEDYSNGWLNKNNSVSKSWELQRVFSDGAQIFTNSINDMAPGLKSFLIQTNIPASPNSILAALINGRIIWDSNVIGVKRVGPCGKTFDIVRFQYRQNLITLGKCSFMARRWTYSELENETICSLIECSITSREEGNNLIDNIDNLEKVCVYESKFLIVPRCAGFSQITYISRIDFKGRPSCWYEQVYAEMLVRQMQRLTQYLLKYRNRGIVL